MGERRIRLTAAGTRDREHMKGWGPGIRACYIIHYVSGGSGYLKVNGKCYRVTAGESFLIRPFTMVEYYPAEEEPWEYYWVDFTGDEAEEYLAMTGFGKEQPVCGTIPGEQLLPLYQRLLERDILQKNRWEADGILMTILGIYLDGFPGVLERHQGQDRIATALALIESGYHRCGFHVEQLCSQMNVSRVTLYRLFEQEQGLSPNRYLMNYRLEQAKKMLAMGATVKSTAASCGFADVFYFSRAFKKYQGIAPSEYRKDMRNY